MGTNYYVNWNPPGYGALSIQLHVCKSLNKFQGAMFGSWQQWKQWLVYQDAEIVTEYGGDVYPLTEFIRDVEAVPVEARRRQTQWVKDHYPDRSARDWWDDEGYSFHRGEFF